MFLRAFIVWLLIAVAEVLHGIQRVRLLNRRVGDRRARQIGVFSGSAIILAIAWVAAPWIGANTVRQLFGVGSFWLMLMLAFDMEFGRFVFHAPWERILSEFDVRRGGLLGFGMLFVFFASLLAAILRGLI
jgi:hypothetical protein